MDWAKKQREMRKSLGNKLPFLVVSGGAWLRGKLSAFSCLVVPFFKEAGNQARCLPGKSARVLMGGHVCLCREALGLTSHVAFLQETWTPIDLSSFRFSTDATR